jgi:deazaflavin-dependent oxidoreductase (nitroreductase family)
MYRRSNGRRGGTVGANKRPVALLATTGRRTGEEREWPVIYLRDGDRIVVVASNGGRDHNPAWYLNLQADPRCVVQRGGDRVSMTARDADPVERAELWPRLTAMYSGYDDYAAKTSRVLPVVLLERANRR